MRDKNDPCSFAMYSGVQGPSNGRGGGGGIGILHHRRHRWDVMDVELMGQVPELPSESMKNDMIVLGSRAEKKVGDYSRLDTTKQNFEP